MAKQVKIPKYTSWIRSDKKLSAAHKRVQEAQTVLARQAKKSCFVAGLRQFEPWRNNVESHPCVEVSVDGIASPRFCYNYDYQRFVKAMVMWQNCESYHTHKQRSHHATGATFYESEQRASEVWKGRR